MLVDYRHIFSRLQSIVNGMEVELEEMKHGKVLNLGNIAQEKKKKVRELKGKKMYNELLQYANTMPPVKQKYLIKGNALIHLKKWEELIECCNRGLDIQEDSQFYNMRGRALGKLNKIEEKAQNTKKAIQLDPTVAAYYRNYGAALYKLKKYHMAIQNHKIAINKEPNNSLNYHNVGAALFRLDQFDEASEYLKKAVQLNRKQPLSHSWLGDCYKAKGQLQKAIDCYTIAYEVSGKQMYRNDRDKLQKQLHPKKGFFSKLFS